MLKTTCLVSILLLAGCKKDIKYLYVIDTDHVVCAQREVTNQDTLASKWVADLSLPECDGNVSITAEDFVRLRKNLKGN